MDGARVAVVVFFDFRGKFAADGVRFQSEFIHERVDAFLRDTTISFDDGLHHVLETSHVIVTHAGETFHRRVRNSRLFARLVAAEERRNIV